PQSQLIIQIDRALCAHYNVRVEDVTKLIYTGATPVFPGTLTVSMETQRGAANRTVPDAGIKPADQLLHPDRRRFGAPCPPWIGWREPGTPYRIAPHFQGPVCLSQQFLGWPRGAGLDQDFEQVGQPAFDALARDEPIRAGKRAEVRAETQDQVVGLGDCRPLLGGQDGSRKANRPGGAVEPCGLLVPPGLHFPSASCCRGGRGTGRPPGLRTPAPPKGGTQGNAPEF